jgi:hypothetical protein
MHLRFFQVCRSRRRRRSAVGCCEKDSVAGECCGRGGSPPCTPLHRLDPPPPAGASPPSAAAAGKPLTRPCLFFPSATRERSRQEGDDQSVSCASCMRCMATLAHAAWPTRAPPPSLLFLFISLPTATWKTHLGRPTSPPPHGPGFFPPLFNLKSLLNCVKTREVQM